LIISQPQCDKADAASIFWGADPPYYIGHADDANLDSEGFRIFDKVLRNWKAGLCARAELAWDENLRERYRAATISFTISATRRATGSHISRLPVSHLWVRWRLARSSRVSSADPTGGRGAMAFTRGASVNWSNAGGSVPLRPFRVLTWIVIALILLLSLVPPTLRPVTGAPHNLEHFAIFALCGFCFGLGYGIRLIPAIGLATFSAVVEALQLLVPGRHARLIDLVVDSLACGAGMLIAWLVIRHGPFNRAPGKR
jgi:VanZ family protein